jgi:deazaflavin-dependent oxidoreductase (nitroreductase family)
VDHIDVRLGSRLYRGPLAGWMGRWHLLLLLTTGRKSGLPRATALTFMTRPDAPGYVVAAGMGQRCDWYRNLLANPHVEIQVGRQHFRRGPNRCST